MKKLLIGLLVFSALFLAHPLVSSADSADDSAGVNKSPCATVVLHNPQAVGLYCP